jgi:hypothetical protein
MTILERDDEMARPKSNLVLSKNQIAEIRKLADNMEATQQMLFLSTLDRYETQLDLVDKLRAEMEKAPTTVKKEYVKGRENVVINPLIQSYNQSVASANKTAETLMKIYKTNAESLEEKPDDPLMDILNGTVD